MSDEYVEHRDAIIQRIYKAATQLADERDEYRRLIDRLERALIDTGPQPRWHWKIVKKHRREWPTVWKAIDDLIAYRNGERQRWST